jgi:hypothetical protein
LVYFVVIWNIFSCLVCRTRKKSGNPEQHRRQKNAFWLVQIHPEANPTAFEFTATTPAL